MGQQSAALRFLARECRRSAQTIEETNIERSSLSRAALAAWRGPAADEFDLRNRRAEAATTTVVAELRSVARRLDAEASVEAATATLS